MSKRFIDIIISIIILLISAPILMCILTLAAYLTKASPLIVQKRSLTLENNCINIWKIRTIIESKKFRNIESNSKKIFDKPEFEKFVPSFCKWLRKCGIDEFPQLINVIKGELSLVGPRPMLEKDLKLMKESEPDTYRIRTLLKSRPGITGYWQLFGEREKGSKNLVALDIFYEFNKSFSLDLKLILKTIIVMLGGKHSDSIVSAKLRNNKRIESKISELSFGQDQ